MRVIYIGEERDLRWDMSEREYRDKRENVRGRERDDSEREGIRERMRDK